MVIRCPSPLSADPREAFHRPAGPPRLLVMTRLWWAAAVSVSGGSTQVSDTPLQGRLSTAPSCVRLPQEKQNPNSEFNTKNLVLTTLNLFFAGTETVSSTLRYGFLLLMKHPGVEGKGRTRLNGLVSGTRASMVRNWGLPRAFVIGCTSRDSSRDGSQMLLPRALSLDKENLH